ncbi:transcription factor 7-like 1-B [Phycodurus eques]|uniref:transcription factor 7-like 1-B n=1 Tax=Phycodurus eques TaxID=693459 RepID=UPI002ACDAE55|nr:transcription factor 7-like 1-B [Phycodurus eques]
MDDQEWKTITEVINTDLGKMIKNQAQVDDAPHMVSDSQGPARVIIGQICYQLVPGAVLPPPRPLPPNSKRTRNTSGPKEERPYIKKPPNAFMLFMKERRPVVKAQFQNSDSAAVNKILGQMWKSLTPAEQLPFFQESERLSLMHASMHPDWTCRDNYGIKKKRKWACAATSSNHLTSSAPELATLFNQNEGPEFDSILELAESVSQSSSTDAGPEADLTSALFRQLEELEAAEAAAASFSTFCCKIDTAEGERSKDWTILNI